MEAANTAAKKGANSRVAFVTGGNRGIGKEIARGLVRAGVTVIVAARDRAIGEEAMKELSADGVALFHPFDVTQESSLRAAVSFVEERFGRLDILVNNAGIAGLPRPASEVPGSEMRRVFDTNVASVVDTIEAFLPLLRRSPAGRIVNVSSHRGSLTAPEIAFVTQPNMAYSVSKSALNAVTQHFAYEFAGTSIKINAGGPRHCATAFNNFSPRGRSPAEGAKVLIELALLGEDGPNGGFFDDEGAAPW